MATSALGAVGDIAQFPSPGGAVPTHPTLGPDGAMWFVGTYLTDPGLGTTARRQAVRRRENGSTPCCSRLIRVTPGGEIAARGATPFGDKWINGLTTLNGSLWVLTSTGASADIWRYATDGATTALGGVGAAAGLITGPDGALWFASTTGVGRMTTTGTLLSGYPVGGAGQLAPGLSVAWTAVNTPALRRIGPDGTVTDFPTVSPAAAIAASPDGSVWYTDAGDRIVGRLVPGEGARQTTGPSPMNPAGVTVAPDGTAWATDQNAGVIHRVTPSLGVESFVVPGALSTQSPAVGADGNVWFGAFTGAAGTVVRVLTGTVPVNTGAPGATGKVRERQAVTATPGSWQYTPTGYRYQWQRCAGASAAACTDIAGATTDTYAVAAADIGAGIRVRVAAGNLNGWSESAASDMLTGDSLPSNRIRLGKTIRRGYALSTRVTVPGPGNVVHFATVRSGRTVRACGPLRVAPSRAGSRTLRCVLSPRARALLRRGPLVLTLTTQFTPRDGLRSSTVRRVRVPRIP